ncbi:hypothetical protein ABNF65_22225 [Paenibacillus larvae]
MLAATIYIGLGIVDVLAVMAFMLKLYRIPFKLYMKKIFMMALVIALISYLIRVVWGVPLLDFPIQVMAFILFLRYGLKIKFFYSTLIVSTGMNGYIILQLLILFIFTVTGNATATVALQNQEVGIQTIQTVSIIAALLIACLLKLFNRGFSFIIEPPHEFSIKEEYMKGANRPLFFSTFIVLAVLSIALMMVYHFYTIILIASALISFVSSYYFSYRRDVSYD